MGSRQATHNCMQYGSLIMSYISSKLYYPNYYGVHEPITISLYH